MPLMEGLAVEVGGVLKRLIMSELARALWASGVLLVMLVEWGSVREDMVAVWHVLVVISLV